MKRFSRRKALAFGIVIGLLSGCKTVEYRQMPLNPLPPVKTEVGIYHKVRKGETLWRIAKTYNIPVEDIIRSNNIPNAALIEENQLLFIPNADQALSVTLPTGDDLSSDEFGWPLQGTVSVYFNEKAGLYFNRGIHIKTREGSIVRASREGRIVFADDLNGYAKMIMIDHLDGFYTVYGNNSSLNIGVGDYVFKGQEIARLGKVGKEVFLHFEIRQGHRATNPMYYLP